MLTNRLGLWALGLSLFGLDLGTLLRVLPMMGWQPYLVVKPRCAATLALMGWYLIVPPVGQPGNRVESNAALSVWQISGTFDTKEHCESVLGDLIKFGPAERQAQTARHRGGDENFDETLYHRLLEASVCVSPYQPR